MHTVYVLHVTQSQFSQMQHLVDLLLFERPVYSPLQKNDDSLFFFLLCVCVSLFKLHSHWLRFKWRFKRLSTLSSSKKCKWAKWEFTLFMMMIHREHQPTESIMHKSWFWLTRSTFKFLDIYFILFYFSVSFFFLLNFNTVTEMSCKCRMAADTRGSHFPHSASVDWLPLSYY